MDRGSIAQQGKLQLFHHPGRYFILRSENIAKRPLIGFGPQMRIAAGLNQLDVNTYLIAGLAHGTFEHMRDIQLCRYCWYIDMLPLVGKRRRTGDHSKFRNLGQQIQ